MGRFLRVFEPFVGSHSKIVFEAVQGLAACGGPPSLAIPKAKILAVLNDHCIVLVRVAQRRFHREVNEGIGVCYQIRGCSLQARRTSEVAFSPAGGPSVERVAGGSSAHGHR